MALHGIPRYTGDMDVFIRISPENAARVESVLRQFGFASLEVAAQDFMIPGRVVQLGIAPYRIDLLTSISGIDFEDAWSDHVQGELGGVPVRFLAVRALRKNKLSAGRPKDLADLKSIPS